MGKPASLIFRPAAMSRINRQNLRKKPSGHALQQSNMSMKTPLCIDDFPFEASIYSGFYIAKFDCQRFLASVQPVAVRTFGSGQRTEGTARSGGSKTCHLQSQRIAETRMER